MTATEAVYVLQESPKSDVQGPKSEDHLEKTLDSRLKTQDSAKATAVYMKLAGANENSTSSGLEEMPHKTNYFKGEESNWRTEIPNFKQIQINNIYEGIDAFWKGRENGGVQYDFVVKPNANPNQIEWEIEGAESFEIDEKGDLLIKTEFGEIRQQKPFTYQKNSNGFRQEIESRFVVKKESSTQNQKSKIAFELGNYDRTKTLTIDPSVNLSNLAYSTFLGGGDYEEGTRIAVDRAGSVYFLVSTLSLSFPTTAGTIDTTHNGNFDVVVTKLNAAGSALDYSTFIGGSGLDNGFDIVIDTSGNVYISGITADSTTNFPTTTGAFDTTHNGNFDVFVTKLNATGSALDYSTFIGGNDDDSGHDIAIDTSGNAFITGRTWSPTYPTTAGAFDISYNGGGDAFVTKLNAVGSALGYSTFIGGSGNDFGNGFAIDTSGNAFITGPTANSTTNFPTTTGAFNTTHNGDFDVFVTKLNAAGSALIYSTFIGGSGFDNGIDLAINAMGNAFLTGFTSDAPTDYPTTAGAFSETHNGSADVFVSKLGDFSISGRTVDTSGNALPNTAVAMSGDGTDFMLSDSGGYFYFGDTLPLSVGYGEYLISATRMLYNFNPPNYQVIPSCVNKRI